MAPSGERPDESDRPDKEERPQKPPPQPPFRPGEPHVLMDQFQRRLFNTLIYEYFLYFGMKQCADILWSTSSSRMVGTSEYEYYGQDENASDSVLAYWLTVFRAHWANRVYGKKEGKKVLDLQKAAQRERDLKLRKQIMKELREEEKNKKRGKKREVQCPTPLPPSISLSILPSSRGTLHFADRSFCFFSVFPHAPSSAQLSVKRWLRRNALAMHRERITQPALSSHSQRQP